MVDPRPQPDSVAILSATVPYPPDSGKKIVMAGLVDYWRARVGAENVHYVLLANPCEGEVDFPVPVVRVRRSGFPEQLAAVALRTVATRRHTLQESMLYARRVSAELGRLLVEIDADVEIYDTVRLGQYAAEFPVRRDERRVVYLDDLFSRRYARMRQAMRKHDGIRIDALGEFRAIIPAPLRPLASAPVVQRALLRTEQVLMARREVGSAQEFAACLLVNPEEAEHLAGHSGTNTVHAIPPLVANGRRPTRRDADGSRQFAFLGRMTLPHNHDAMAAFLARQMPELLHRVPDVVLRIVGGGVASELQSLAARWGDHVRIDGYVADLDQVLARSCAMVSPLRFGSGVKLKVLEALARGVPVISTSVGAEGIATGPDQGVLVEDDLDRHPQLMQWLTRQHVNERMSQAARAHFDGTFSQEAVFRRYDDLFGF
jgi:glycosyltransferase involved in cell wall biosynthesis